METLLKLMIWGYHYFWKHPNICSHHLYIYIYTVSICLDADQHCINKKHSAFHTSPRRVETTRDDTSDGLADWQLASDLNSARWASLCVGVYYLP